MFYFMPLHVSSIFAHHHEVKISLHSLWYHHTYRCDGMVSIPHGHLHRLTYNRGCIDTIDSPNDEYLVARNMYRIGINNYKKTELCVKLVFYKNYTWQVRVW